MTQELNYRCSNDACGRGWPRQVAFCPYCGTQQQAASEAPVEQRAATPAAAPPHPAAIGVSADAAQNELDFEPPSLTHANAAIRDLAPPSLAKTIASAQAEVSRGDGESEGAQRGGNLAWNSGQGGANKPPAVQGPALSSAMPEWASPAPPARKLVPDEIPEPPAQGSNSRKQANTGGGKQSAAPRAEPPRPGTPLRKPISKTTWAMVALCLLAVWLLMRPESAAKKAAHRVDEAIAMLPECRLADARAELAALTEAKAPKAQTKRLQDAIAGAVPGCEKKVRRDKAWKELAPILESAIKSGTAERAAERLSGFTRKWGESAETKELAGRIDAKRAENLLDEADACLRKNDRACLEVRIKAAEKLKRPETEERIRQLKERLSHLLESTLLDQASSPAPQGEAASATAREVQRLQADAVREMAQGNYRAAIGRASQCMTQTDPGNRECQQLHEKAERLEREYQRCIMGGMTWSNGRCL
ncbi:hypothetical protein [Massilia sp. BJB1822]|uniref:hypothetical protein n=1 Tax=Massilia sp. BJB1822 TaxID=2744470 RepID=UPI001593FD46|nr:hypothetical protein [Massilia sp. BJB1822]NVD98119.1 hypothetical protein [Massilia sp. BJB1822]